MRKARGVDGRATRPVGKPTDLVRLELTTMPFAGICSTTELPVHIGQVGSFSFFYYPIRNHNSEVKPELRDNETKYFFYHPNQLSKDA